MFESGRKEGLLNRLVKDGISANGGDGSLDVVKGRRTPLKSSHHGQGRVGVVVVRSKR